ncbi:MAG: histidine phosphatase family protein [Pseudomonadota bacterium]|nr:histidine phosphatase family protein [Pseudomonadota bacterium]
MPWARRRFTWMLAGLAGLASLTPNPLGAAEWAEDAEAAGEAALWSALKSGGHLIFIRHALTRPGIGDPPGFRLGECRTQRNLSDKGRADARRIGQAFRARDIPVEDVLSSRWCRCLDTAQLAFGRFKPAPMLDSTFNDEERMRQDKARAVLAAVAKFSGPGNLVLVTHAQNIQALTGISPLSGELVVVKLEGQDRFRVIGRLPVPGD